MLRGENGFQRKEILKLVDWLRELPSPDIVALPYSLLISLARPIKEALHCPIVCTLQGEELFLLRSARTLSEPGARFDSRQHQTR